jgi:hypothetical protein
MVMEEVMVSAVSQRAASAGAGQEGAQGGGCYRGRVELLPLGRDLALLPPPGYKPAAQFTGEYSRTVSPDTGVRTGASSIPTHCCRNGGLVLRKSITVTDTCKHICFNN